MKTQNWTSLTRFDFVAALVLAAGLLGSGARAASLNADPAYGKWDPTSIPYCLESVYTPTEVSVINAAIAKIMSDAPFITFTPVGCSDGRYKIRITPLIAGSTAAQPYSWAYPGRYLDLVRQGAKEQLVSIARDPVTAPNGALALRPVMKILVITLGLRNEHQRGDRDTSLNMHPENFSVASAYTKNTPTQASWSAYEFDYCSVTLNTPSDYTVIPSKKAYDLPEQAANYSVFMLHPELSRMDVNALATYYGSTYSSTKQCCVALRSCRESLGRAN